MSTPSSGEDTTVYSTGTRAIDPVTLRNTSSVDCPDSGFIVLLLPNPVSEPAPTLEWRVGGGAWHGTSLSWDDGVVNGNASCASPCWKAGIVTLDVPAHTTYTIDLAVMFHSGRNAGFFAGAVYYTGQAIIPDGAFGVQVAWAYINQVGGTTGGGGTGSGGSAPQHSSSPAAAASTASAPRFTAASPTPSSKASTTPSPSPTTPTPTASSISPAAPTATPSLAPVADAHSGGSGTSAVIALIAGTVLVLAGGAGFVLKRRRRGSPPQSEI